MNDPSDWHAFNYVHADIPDGMAIGKWRRRLTAERIAARMTARAARRCRRRRRLQRWIRPWRVPTPRSLVRGHPARG